MNYSLTNDEINAYQNKLADEQNAINKTNEEDRALAADMQSTVLNALTLPKNKPGQPLQQKPVNAGGAWNGQ